VAMDLSTGRKKTLVHGGFAARYLPTSGKSGHLIFMREGTLFGVAFDPNRLETLGPPRPLLDDVAAGTGTADEGAQYTFTSDGTFAYLTGQSAGAGYPMLLADAAGKTVPALPQPGVYSAPRFSPDGKRLAYIASNSKGFDVWVRDLDRNVSS